MSNSMNLNSALKITYTEDENIVIIYVRCRWYWRWWRIRKIKNNCLANFRLILMRFGKKMCSTSLLARITSCRLICTCLWRPILGPPEPMIYLRPFSPEEAGLTAKLGFLISDNRKNHMCIRRKGFLRGLTLIKDLEAMANNTKLTNINPELKKAFLKKFSVFFKK